MLPLQPQLVGTNRVILFAVPQEGSTIKALCLPSTSRWGDLSMGWLDVQDENMESMQNEGAYRAVLYTCVAAHWVTLLTAMHLVGTTSINPLAMLGETLSAQVKLMCSDV